LPEYGFEPSTGRWLHHRGCPKPPMRLTDLSYRTGKLEYRARHATEPAWVLAGYLEEAKRRFDEAAKNPRPPAVPMPDCSKDFEHLRWFVLPSEAAAELAGAGHVAEGI
jgi:hypothetical protein